jgi:hypothetical protein
MSAGPDDGPVACGQGVNGQYPQGRRGVHDAIVIFPPERLQGLSQPVLLPRCREDRIRCGQRWRGRDYVPLLPLPDGLPDRGLVPQYVHDGDPLRAATGYRSVPLRVQVNVQDAESPERYSRPTAWAVVVSPLPLLVNDGNGLHIPAPLLCVCVSCYQHVYMR